MPTCGSRSILRCNLIALVAPFCRFVWGGCKKNTSKATQTLSKYATTSPLLRGLEYHLVMVGHTDAAHETALNEAREQLNIAGYTVIAKLTPGRPTAAIAEKVKSTDINLLVMGAYGHSQIREFFVSSTTTKMVRTCPASVLMFSVIRNEI